jgi:hypothetical protein
MTAARDNDMKARFYCAYCSTEVGPRAVKCPKCGKYFSAVTCPSCGFKGDANTFLNGCPVCGYLVQQDPEKNRREGAVLRPNAEKKKRFSPAFYAATAIVLGAALVALIVVLLSLNT